MAGPAPSSSLTRLADVWRRLSLRSDVDDIMLELLGRFSLDRIHLGAGDNDAHRKLLTTLLVQLNAIFYIQRLTLPSESLQAGRHLGFLLGWEVAARCAELVLQAVAQGRDGLWEDDWLGAEYLADFLLSALRLLSLHPRPPSPGDRRDRFACVHACLERLLDHHPRPRSFLLAVCREVTDRLRQDASSLGLPPRLRRELPTLASELVPLVLLYLLSFEICSCRILTCHVWPGSIPCHRACCLPTSYRPTTSPSTGSPSSWPCETCPSSSLAHLFNMP